ncbi:M28 family peptidase [Oleiharenicola sp. Vm1]|uniref:M28 family metallopeptidase n=1 Tax=Oleiharenicola sp. Vm1 TaxID=3398393 RepID=UPI0039F5C83B
MPLPRPVLLGLLLAAASASAAEPLLHPASAARILERTKVLASDEFEGRAPGTPGEDKTVAYLVGEFQKLGLSPGNPEGGFLQNAPLVGITSAPTLAFVRDGVTTPMENINDFVGVTARIAPRVEAKDSDVVFVGYGVVAPEFGWDDYKGVDVRGKTVVMLINDPPVTDPQTGELDPKVFGGKAMTYYGRWTYKYEIAAAKGAAACLIVHETGPAAYPFAVVTGSWARENFEISALDQNAGKVGMQGWLTHDAGRRLFASCGLDYEAAKQAAARRDFRPIPLGTKASFVVENRLRNVASRNVVALLPGSDPKLRDEFVIYSAHWDHLGRDPKLPGDQIYNGAADNAAGCAVLLEIAELMAKLPPEKRPKRSVLFLSVTAEEKGLLGSRYYAENPLYPLTQTLANINIDGANQFGPTSDMTTIGFGASTIDDIGVAVAKAMGRTMGPEAHPEFGSYYRSDHFEFAKVGVPSYYPKNGRRYIGQPDDFAEKQVKDYIANRYHKPSDEVQPDWTFEGAAQDTAFLVEVGLRIANGDTWPQWRAGNEFKAKRDAMMKPQQ